MNATAARESRYEHYDPRVRERLPEYEVEARAHYVAMGFDYPSGLMARVRELTP